MHTENFAEWGAYQGDKVSVPALAFSPDGRRVASGTSDGRVSVFDVARVPAGVTVGG